MDGVMKRVRTALRMKQTEIAEQIGISRGLWSVHESKDDAGGHDMPPHIARSLKKLARSKGMPLTYENLYEGEPLPEMVLVPAKVLERRAARKAAPPPVVAPPAEPPAPEKRRRRVVMV